MLDASVIRGTAARPRSDDACASIVCRLRASVAVRPALNFCRSAQGSVLLLSVRACVLSGRGGERGVIELGAAGEAAAAATDGTVAYLSLKAGGSQR